MAEMVSGYASNYFLINFTSSFNFKKAHLNKPKHMAFLKFCGEKHPYFLRSKFPKAPHSIANERSFSTLLLRSEHIKGRESYGEMVLGYGINYFLLFWTS
jgi:hypothetical protein